MLVTVEDHGHSRAVFRPLDVIRWVKVTWDASAADTGYDAVDAIGRQLEAALDENEGMPLIARIEIAGASRAHEELASNLDRWTNEIRAVALDAGTGRVWIEKVKLATRTPLGGDTPEMPTEPIGELLQYLEEVRKDPDELEALAESLGDLMKRLPRELKEGPDALLGEDKSWLGNLLDQIRPMLLHRLTRRGDSP
jgi:hypothetical protein